MRNITQLFKSLSDPTRVRIIWLLVEGGELCVCDLVEVLTLPQSTVSRHLAYLRNAGLVTDQRTGVWMYYRLPGELTELSTGILSLLQPAAKNSQQAEQDRRRSAAALALEEHPVLAADRDRAHAALRAVVVDLEPAVGRVGHERGPLALRVADRLAEWALRKRLRLENGESCT